MISTPTRVVWSAIIAFPSAVHGLNSTSQSSAESSTLFTGWRSGGDDRGTMTLVWNCLSTIIACTWTILHLNVPGSKDTWMKILRKAKWMIITIVFPEFIFAKAVCELQMAVEDLHDLKQKEQVFGWQVEYGQGSDLLYRGFKRGISWGKYLLHTPDRRPVEPGTAEAEDQSPAHGVAPNILDAGEAIHPVQSPDVELSTARSLAMKFGLDCWGDVHEDEGRKWTLTHCYFANMGGLVFEDKGSPLFGLPLTTHGLLKCCIPQNHNPVHNTILSELEISDKSKADWLVKLLATLQIFWLVVSIITRLARGLPVSQLEVCTVAFAALAVVTYAMNWAKPKDVEVPVWISSPQPFACKPYNFYGASFSQRSVRPSEKRTVVATRISNDTLRLQTEGEQFLTFSFALTVSTAVFGSIHCAAWRTDFPTNAERILWLVASVLSTTLPLINLVATGITNGVLCQKFSQCLAKIKREGEASFEYDYSKNDRQVLFWKENKLWSQEDSPTEKHSQVLPVANDFLSRARVFNNQIDAFLMRSVPQYNSISFWYGWELCERAYIRALESGYRFTDAPADTANYSPWGDEFEGLPFTCDDISEERWRLIMNLITRPDRPVAEIRKQWLLASAKADAISGRCTLFSACLYGIARIIIIVIAFTTLRRQDERLYIETWTHFLPSIG